MSAIFGIINKNGSGVDKAMINKMQQSLLHRAVDGKNICVAENIMFGHHKLIVHRRQSLEQQPLHLDDCIITSDARIDNIDELIKELEINMPITSISDSFIILKAYKKWGNNCAKHLEGEFTFAIWDRVEKQFFGASDHIGFRTFYYYENDEIFAFASEIKAIESIKLQLLEINYEIFFDYYMNVHRPITYDKNISVLQSGHFLSLAGKNKVKMKRYWLAKETRKYKFEKSSEWYTCLVDIVTKKIKQQIDTDHPVGIMLSGGLDSSFVTAIACRLLKKENKRLIALSSVLPENYQGADKDERFFIEKLKTHYNNLDVHYVSVLPEIGPYSNLEDGFEKVENPLHLFHYVDTALDERARQLNIRTVLSGFGGDMMVSHGGNVVIAQYLTQGKIIRALRLFIKKYKESTHSFHYHVKHEILSHVQLYKNLKQFFKPTDEYLDFPLKRKLLKKIVKTENSRNNFYSKSIAHNVNHGEIGSTLLRIRKQASAFNEEFLSPLLSKEVCDFFMDVPGEELYKKGMRRSLIKGAMAGLVPVEILNRKDKLPYSSDYNKRIAQVSPKDLNEIFESIDIEKIGIDYEKTFEIVSTIDHTKLSTMWNINKKLYYIPFIIIAAGFLKWLDKKSSKCIISIILSSVGTFTLIG